MPKEKIKSVVSAWLLAAKGYTSPIADVKKPLVLKKGAQQVAKLMWNDLLGAALVKNNRKQPVFSAHQLIVDLVDCTTREG